MWFYELFKWDEPPDFSPPGAKVFRVSNPRINKTLAIWPEESSGVVVGLVRKGIGESVSHGSYFNGETTEFEPGYFAAEEWAWLYVIKHSLSGPDDNLVFVPMNAVEPI